MLFLLHCQRLLWFFFWLSKHSVRLNSNCHHIHTVTLILFSSQAQSRELVRELSQRVDPRDSLWHNLAAAASKWPRYPRGSHGCVCNAVSSFIKRKRQDTNEQSQCNARESVRSGDQKHVLLQTKHQSTAVHHAPSRRRSSQCASNGAISSSYNVPSAQPRVPPRSSPQSSSHRTWQHKRRGRRKRTRQVRRDRHRRQEQTSRPAQKAVSTSCDANRHSLSRVCLLLLCCEVFYGQLVS